MLQVNHSSSSASSNVCTESVLLNWHFISRAASFVLSWLQKYNILETGSLSNNRQKNINLLRIIRVNWFLHSGDNQSETHFYNRKQSACCPIYVSFCNIYGLKGHQNTNVNITLVFTPWGKNLIYEIFKPLVPTSQKSACILITNTNHSLLSGK